MEDDLCNLEDKKFRLFGFEVDLSTQVVFGCREESNIHDERRHPRCINFRHASVPKQNTKDRRKYSCQFCLKEFSNSQALGGHQNAHKNERLKKKRLELLQARKAGVGCYLQTLIKSHSFDYSSCCSIPWFCDHPSQSSLEYFLGNDFHVPRKMSLTPWMIQQNRNTASTVLQFEGEKENTIAMSEQQQLSKRNLDIQLGLGVKSSICKPS